MDRELDSDADRNDQYDGRHRTQLDPDQTHHAKQLDHDHRQYSHL